MQHFQEVRCGNIRKCLWLTLENPGYSIPSKLFSLVSIGVVLTSIATMCINSIPEYQVGGAFSSVLPPAGDIRSTTRTNSRFTVQKPKLFLMQTFDEEGKLVEDSTMRVLEVFCSCWFTFEVRSVTSKRLRAERRC